MREGGGSKLPACATHHVSDNDRKKGKVDLSFYCLKKFTEPGVHSVFFYDFYQYIHLSLLQCGKGIGEEES